MVAFEDSRIFLAKSGQLHILYDFETRQTSKLGHRYEFSKMASQK
jgi:hypothetical protein